MIKETKPVSELSDATLSARVVKDSQRLKRLLLSKPSNQETTDNPQHELQELESRIEAVLCEIEARYS